MSHIDSFDHSHVGTLCGILLYHPLMNIDIEHDEKIYATPENFLLGGGSGEHASMIIKNLAFCAFLYLEHVGNLQGKELMEECENYLNRLNDDYYKEMTVYDNLIYQWDMKTVSDFVERVEKDFHDVSPQYLCDRISPEIMIQILVGQIVHQYAMHLLSMKDVDIIAELEQHLDMTQVPDWRAFSPAIAGNSYGRYLRQDNGSQKYQIQSLSFEEEDIARPYLNEFYDRGKKFIK